jgi:hypothetical protein
MRRETNGPILSAVFVDYDNIYLSLKRKNDEAAKRFSKDAGHWLKAIETGELITASNVHMAPVQRRIVMSRCYGNPVPRRNQSDNSTDMSSFPFVRHHFLRGGFEIIDCPPLTAQLKNSSDIRMVMDVRDYISHDTYFDEFVILSGDADFTPLLHRLRSHARRTIIFANDHTAAPYTAICDGEVREADLIRCLLDGKVTTTVGAAPTITAPAAAPISVETLRAEIIADVVAQVRSAGQPLPLEVLADRATRTLGHEKTVGSNWAAAGSFRELLAQSLPPQMRLTETAPYLVFELAQAASERATIARQPQPLAIMDAPTMSHPQPALHQAPTVTDSAPTAAVLVPGRSVIGQPAETTPLRPTQTAPIQAPTMQQAARSQIMPAPDAIQATPVQQPQPQRQAAPDQQIRTSDGAAQLQQSIARIHEACQAPPLSPPEYRALFEVMAQEINQSNLQGAQTIDNIARLAQQMGIDVRRDDVRFILEVVSEADPWFEQGASASLFSGRFRNFVVARCRSQGLHLSADELDLIDAWFAGPADNRTVSGRQQPRSAARAPDAAPHQPQAQPQRQIPQARGGDRWWTTDDGRQTAVDPRSPQRPAGQAGLGEFQPGADLTGEDFPRILKNRGRS